MERKVLQEQMIKFTVSAPGRIKLFGGNGLKYTGIDLISSLNMRTIIEFTELPQTPQGIIEIKFNHIGLSCKVSLRTFIEYFHDIYDFDDDITHDVLRFKAHNFIIEQQLYDTPIQRKFLQIFFYLLVNIGYKEEFDIRSFQINISTNLTDAHLGKKPSCITCLAMCFLHWSRMQKGVYDTYNNDDLMKLLFYASSYPTVSKFMNIINLIQCIFGTMFKFQINNGQLIFDQLHTGRDFSNMTILLVDTLQNRDELKQAARMDLPIQFPFKNRSVINCINNISNKAANIFTQIDQFDLNNTHDTARINAVVRSKHENIETLINVNQEWLITIRASNNKVNTICSIAARYAFSGKCTEDGRYALIWLPEYKSDAQLQPLICELEKNGFIVSKQELNCEGVRIED